MNKVLELDETDLKDIVKKWYGQVYPADAIEISCDTVDGSSIAGFYPSWIVVRITQKLSDIK